MHTARTAQRDKVMARKLENMASLLLLLVVSLALVAGCASAPKKELAAAEKALLDASFAEECAGETYRAARKMLEDARKANAAGEYDEARRKALAAQKLAEQARNDAEINREECEKRLAAKNLIDKKLDTGKSTQPPTGLSATDLSDTYMLQTIYFAFDQSALTPEAQETLNLNAAWLLEHPDVRILIEGHTDNRGTIEYNLALSQQRAQSVRRYLQTLGVEESRMKPVALGEQKPAADDHAQNRRAEFRVKE